jgi:hypothetical protein
LIQQVAARNSLKEFIDKLKGLHLTYEMILYLLHHILLHNLTNPTYYWLALVILMAATKE